MNIDTFNVSFEPKSDVHCIAHNLQNNRKPTFDLNSISIQKQTLAEKLYSRYQSFMTIYFIRHGQSEFNSVFKNEGDPMIFDAPLTELGKQQALAAREQVKLLGIKQAITSPFTRAIQTTRLIFNDLAPIEVRSGHHEHLLHSCDVGRPPSALKSAFPDLRFEHLSERWWHHVSVDENEIAVEPMSKFEARIQDFVEHLHTRTDLPLAVIGHGNAFKQIIGHALENCEIYKYR